MKVRAIECPKCGDKIYSRARHDFHSCSCDTISIDGGFDYMKVSAPGDIIGGLKTITIKINATKEELYNDWNKGIDKFGTIRGRKDGQ